MTKNPARNSGTVSAKDFKTRNTGLKSKSNTKPKSNSKSKPRFKSFLKTRKDLNLPTRQQKQDDWIDLIQYEWQNKFRGQTITPSQIGRLAFGPRGNLKWGFGSHEAVYEWLKTVDPRKVHTNALGFAVACARNERAVAQVTKKLDRRHAPERIGDVFRRLAKQKPGKEE